MFSFFKAIGKLQNGEWTFVMVKEYSHEKVEHMFACLPMEVIKQWNFELNEFPTWEKCQTQE